VNKCRAWKRQVSITSSQLLHLERAHREVSSGARIMRSSMVRVVEAGALEVIALLPAALEVEAVTVCANPPTHTQKQVPARKRRVRSSTQIQRIYKPRKSGSVLRFKSNQSRPLLHVRHTRTPAAQCTSQEQRGYTNPTNPHLLYDSAA
jgi:hypothetical protein